MLIFFFFQLTSVSTTFMLSVSVCSSRYCFQSGKVSSSVTKSQRTRFWCPVSYFPLCTGSPPRYLIPLTFETLLHFIVPTLLYVLKTFVDHFRGTEFSATWHLFARTSWDVPVSTSDSFLRRVFDKLGSK